MLGLCFVVCYYVLAWFNLKLLDMKEIFKLGHSFIYSLHDRLVDHHV